MNLGREIQREIRRLLRGGEVNRAEVVYFWDAPSPAPDYDPILEASLPATTLQSGTATALVHFVGPITSGVRQFAEVEAGDVIIDFVDDIELPKNCWFLIDGKKWVQKSVGAELSEYWDTLVAGRRILRTVLATLAR